MTEPREALHNTTDARAWATEFMRLFPNGCNDEGTMLGWFANAIETGRAVGALARSEGPGLDALHRLDRLILSGALDDAHAGCIRIVQDALAAQENPTPHINDIDGPHPESPDWHAGYRAGRSEGPGLDAPDEETENCPTCMRPMAIPQRGDHDYGLRLSARSEGPGPDAHGPHCADGWCDGALLRTAAQENPA